MHTILFSLALMLSSAPSAADGALYSVELSQLLDAGARGLQDAYPDISPDDVRLANDVWVHCWSTRPAEHVYTPDESFKPCEALVVFDLSATRAEHTYFNRDGDCVKVAPPGEMHISVYEDGSSKTETFKGRNSEVEVLDCTEDVIARIADGSRTLPGTGEAFSIDPRRILERAFAAAIEDSPETAPESLDFDGQISLFCDVTVAADGEAGRDVLIRPCTAELTFLDRSTPVEPGYIQEGDRCFVGPTFDAVRVHLDADGNARVGRVGGPWAQVACDQAFQQAMEQSKEQSMDGAAE